MKIPQKQIESYSDELHEKLLPQFVGKVFHVTTVHGIKRILKSGSIKNNKNRDFELTYPQSGNSYGRKRGYTCFVDLRGVLEEELKLALDKYYFLNPKSCNDNPIFLFISEELHSDLIRWSQAKKEIGYREMFVPYIESWYPDDISVEYITNIINLSVKHKPVEFNLSKEEEEALSRRIESARKRMR